jgi:hypothetical protein
VTFGAGNSTATVTVDPSADTTFETDETVILTVAAGTGYGIGAPNSATGTITNDDAAFPGVRLVITSAFRCEAGNVINAVTISNVGDTTAFSVQLTQAALQSPVQNGSPLPLNYGDIGPGQSVTLDVNFGSIPAGQRVLKLRGTFGAGLQFGATQLVQIPNCSVVQSTPDTRNGTWASYGPRLDRLVSHEDDDLISFLTQVNNEVPTSQEWVGPFDWNLTEVELLLYWLTTDTYFQRNPQQSSHLPVVHAVAWVSRISDNGSNEGVGR